jgi:HEPN domain-containing protein
MNKQRTAVEFYRSNLMALVSTGETDFKTEPELFEQAKEMEKHMLTDAYHDGKTNGMDISHPLSLTKEISAEEWYNETYGNDKQ